MPFKINRLHALSHLALLASSAAWSQPLSVEASIGVARYRSTETSISGAVLNRELGNMPMLSLGIQETRGPWFVRLTQDTAGDDVVYQGSSQIGFPIITKTKLRWSEWAVRAGHGWAVSDTSVVTMSTGIGKLSIDRHILPSLGSLGLQEQLDTWRASLAANLQLRPAKAPLMPAQITMGVEALPALRTRLQVNSFGLYDAVTLAPGRSVDWRTHVQAQWDVAPGNQFWLQIGHASYKPTRSDIQVWTRGGVPAATVTYPGSQQQLSNLRMGWLVAF
jgi:hypothetical protein